MKRLRKSWIAVVSVCLVISGSLVSRNPFAESTIQEKCEVQNVIFLIGDGMGLPYTSAYRYFKNTPFTKEMERTSFDPFLVGTQITYPNDPKENVTDSAAAATAMATGVKSYNGAVAVDENKHPVQTVLERAKAMGKSTGLVVTSKITDATPACFAAHVTERWNNTEIANQYIDQKINGSPKVDVLLGGGTEDFIRPDRNLVDEFKKEGYSNVSNAEELKQNVNPKILGLFAPNYLPKMIDRTQSIPSLRQMEEAALGRLSKNKRGFFLMVEGSQIDIAGHRNDIVGAMSEMTDFEEAFQAAIDFAKKDKHTLVVMTADHSTGGLTVGANKIYSWDPVPIKQAKRSAEFMANEVKLGARVEDIFSKYVSFALTSEELQTLKSANNDSILSAICKVFATRSHTGWTTSGHTGEDIPVYAFGPGSAYFMGVHENTHIAQSLLQLLR